MPGLHLVLVSLHVRFTISICGRQLELVTLNTICSVGSKLTYYTKLVVKMNTFGKNNPVLLAWFGQS